METGDFRSRSCSKEDAATTPIFERVYNCNLSVSSWIPLEEIVGLPLDAVVTVLETGRSVRTNPSNGSYSMALPASEGVEHYTLLIESYGYYPVELPISISAQQQIIENINMEMIPRGSISGKVVDAGTGNPLANTEVTYYAEDWLSVFTDIDGNFCIEDIPEGNCTLRAIATGYLISEFVLDVISDEESSQVDFELRPIGDDFDYEIAYDNDKCNLTVRHSNAGNGFAQRMTPNGTVQLRGVRVYFPSWGQISDSGEFTIMIYDSLPNGLPGKRVTPPIVKYEEKGRWVYLDLTEYGFVTDKDFFVVIMQSRRGDFSLSLGFCEQSSERTYQYRWNYAHGGFFSQADYGAAMIRATVDEVPVNESKYVGRICGNNRYGTAVAISQAGWASSGTVVLARGDDYADALAGVPLAYVYDAPILLTAPNRLISSTREEIIRLGAEKVVILGGEGAVSSSVAQILEDELQLEVRRISGASRYGTAAAVAAALAEESGTAEKAILAYGQDFPDALAAASYAATEGYPILLVRTNRLTDATESIISELGINDFIVVGGSSVISDELLNQLTSAVRVAGGNRYVTATKLADYFAPDCSKVYLATGLDFADAITGGVLAAKNNSGMLLVHSNRIAGSVQDYIRASGYRRGYIFGGTGAVNDHVAELVEALIRE